MDDVRAITPMRRGDNCPQSHDGFLGQAIAEVLLRGIAAQVFKRKNGEHDARPFRLYRCGLDRTNFCPGLEAIPFAEDGLDISRVGGIFSQRVANFSDGGVNAVIGVEVDVFPPQAHDDFFATDQSSIFPDQENQQIHGDAFQMYRFSATSQLISAYIQNELAKSHSL
jgi:hypothetical protein